MKLAGHPGILTAMKNQAAVELGRRGGLARKKNLTPEQRRAIATKASAARWKKHKREKKNANQ